MALAADAVLAVLGVAIPAVVGVADPNEPVDAPEASPLSAAINPAGALAGAYIAQYRSAVRAEEEVPGIIRGAPWCADISKTVRLTAPGSVTGTYRNLPLDAVYRFMEPKGELPSGYVLHVWSLARDGRTGMLGIVAPSDAGAPDVAAVFEAFSAFLTTDAALEDSYPPMD